MFWGVFLSLFQPFLQGPCPPVSSLWWARGESFSQELLGEPSSQMNGSFFVQGNTRFPCQGIFCFWKRGVKRRGEQCRVYFKVHLDFISSKSCELPEQGEEPLVFLPLFLETFPCLSFRGPRGFGGPRGWSSHSPQSLTEREKLLKGTIACGWSRIREQTRDARSQRQHH